MIAAFRMALLAWVTVVVAGCATVASPAAPSQLPGAAPSTAPAPDGIARPHGDPEAVAVPRIGAFSSLIPLGLNSDGTVEVPPLRNPMQAGWYRLGPRPGEPGNAVILGHVDGDRQPGIFYRLHELQPGDDVVISSHGGGATHFRVRRVQQVAKDAFPAGDVYGVGTRPELRLITCGGTFDPITRNYRDNVIVYASVVP